MSVSVIGDPFATLEARLDFLDAMRQELLDYLDRRQQPYAPLRQQDVPLHQRGFGVMDEPPA
jgi:hypothetical protein